MNPIELTFHRRICGVNHDMPTYSPYLGRKAANSVRRFYEMQGLLRAELLQACCWRNYGATLNRSPAPQRRMVVIPATVVGTAGLDGEPTICYLLYH